MVTAQCPQLQTLFSFVCELHLGSATSQQQLNSGRFPRGDYGRELDKL